MWQVPVLKVIVVDACTRIERVVANACEIQESPAKPPQWSVVSGQEDQVSLGGNPGILVAARSEPPSLVP